MSPQTFLARVASYGICAVRGGRSFTCNGVSGLCTVVVVVVVVVVVAVAVIAVFVVVSRLNHSFQHQQQYTQCLS